jgi:hypothetical protein
MDEVGATTLSTDVDIRCIFTGSITAARIDERPAAR